MTNKTLPVLFGEVETDAFGYAEVEWDSPLPASGQWHYMLTIIDDGEGFPQAKVVEEALGEGFTIRTSEPFVRVCWQARRLPAEARHPTTHNAELNRVA